MKIGVTLRNMGPQSSPALMLSAARAAEAAGMESVWVTDHIAIPPDDAEGSNGRYLDPLITLSVLAGATERIGLGAGVLILPYRPPLPTAKQIASLQELSAERLLLGVGIGWMDAEFRALGVDRHQRGRQSDETLSFINRCFADAGDLAEANGQSFLFRPNPSAPPIYVGGRAPHALQRALRHGAGWLPMGADPERLAGDISQFRALAEAAGAEPGPVTLMAPLPLDNRAQGSELIDRYAALGVERLVCAVRYDTLAEYQHMLDQIIGLQRGS
jgi:probable F420-dependent oxidoreductase